MQTTNLTEALKHLEQEIQKETQELKAEEEELGKTEQETAQLKQEIPTLQKEIDLKKRRLYELESAAPKLKSKIQVLKLGQTKKHADLERVHQEYSRALEHADVKGIKPR